MFNYQLSIVCEKEEQLNSVIETLKEDGYPYILKRVPLTKSSKELGWAVFTQGKYIVDDKEYMKEIWKHDGYRNSPTRC